MTPSDFVSFLSSTSFSQLSPKFSAVTPYFCNFHPCLEFPKREIHKLRNSDFMFLSHTQWYSRLTPYSMLRDQSWWSGGAICRCQGLILGLSNAKHTLSPLNSLPRQVCMSYLFCFWATFGAQDFSPDSVFRHLGPYTVLGMKPAFAKCKASALSTSSRTVLRNSGLDHWEREGRERGMERFKGGERKIERRRERSLSGIDGDYESIIPTIGRDYHYMQLLRSSW